MPNSRNMINPLVSIIVPVYKVEKYLRTCLDSVLSQTYTNWEMILVDDGSPDKSGEICDEYARGDSRLTVLHCENGGLSRARNRALDCPPKGEFVTFLDSDDFWHKNYLSRLVKLCVDYDADISQCNHVKGTDTAFPESSNKVHVNVYDNHSIFLTEKANVVMWGKLFKKEILEGIRMPVGLYNEDDWTMWKLYYRAKSIAVTNQPLYYYTMNPNSTMGKLAKKPDLRYINAYKERIVFFVETGEKDLEHCSRQQLCKSLLLTYCHNKLSSDERHEIKCLFEDSWEELKHSSHIRTLYKGMFLSFHLMPMLTSKFIVKHRYKG